MDIEESDQPRYITIINYIQNQLFLSTVSRHSPVMYNVVLPKTNSHYLKINIKVRTPHFTPKTTQSKLWRVRRGEVGLQRVMLETADKIDINKTQYINDQKFQL